MRRRRSRASKFQPKPDKALKEAAKKFVPPESEDEESVEEPSETEEPAAPPKKLKIKGLKSESQKAGMLKKSKAPLDDESEGEQRVAKGNNGKKVKGAKPATYKKGKWNPNVDLLEKCEQLESESIVPNFDCSTRNSNREVIRAAMIGSRKLLNKIVKSDRKISASPKMGSRQYYDRPEGPPREGRHRRLDLTWSS